MDIYFSSLDRSEVYQLPIISEDMPEFSKSAKNEEFESFDDGIYNILGNVGLISFPIESFLPGKGKNYSFAKCILDNPYALINLWSNAMNTKTPIRVVMYRNDKSEIINLMVSVENMAWHEDKTGDIKYKVDLKEYREP